MYAATDSAYLNVISGRSLTSNGDKFLTSGGGGGCVDVSCSGRRIKAHPAAMVRSAIFGSGAATAASAASATALHEGTI